MQSFSPLKLIKRNINTAEVQSLSKDFEHPIEEKNLQLSFYHHSTKETQDSNVIEGIVKY